MQDRRIVLVTGATGAQGGSVAQHLLRLGTFAVRALTRKPDSERAQALRQAGAEVVHGDVEDFVALRAAMEGSYAVFGVREKFLTKTVGIVGDDRPPGGYAAVMAEVLGRPIVYSHIPREVFASFEFPGAADLANMFEFNRIFIPNRQADLAQSRELYPGIRPFAVWLRANVTRFQALLAA